MRTSAVVAGRVAAVAAAIVVGTAAPARAEPVAEPAARPAATSDGKIDARTDARTDANIDAKAAAKKDRAAQAKSTTHGPPPVPGSKPAKLVNLYNFWTKEWLAVDTASPPPPATVDRFLRDHFTNKPAAMQRKLVDIVVAAAANFHSDVVEVVSGFRHPKYNLILRKKGHQVARDSQHTHGNAIDFFIPRVTAQALQAWARAQKLGGVGLYPESGFVHMDIGPIRSWSGE